MDHTIAPTAIDRDAAMAGDAGRAYSYQLSLNSSVALDLIRGLAAQLVLIGHAIVFFKITIPKLPVIQNVGVVVFFILSGFLITYSTMRKSSRGGYTFSIFAIERFSRIYSGLVPALLLVALLDFLFVDGYHRSFGAFVGNLLMLQDFPCCRTYVKLTSFGSARPLWTLAVEWWIYLFFGYLVLSATFRDQNAWKNLLQLAVVGLLSVVPLYNSVFPGRGQGLFIVWCMGAVIAILLSSPVSVPSLRKSALLALACSVAACLRLLLKPGAYDLIFASFLAASLYFLILSLDQAQPLFHAAVRQVIAFVANYSFTLYMIHYTILVVAVSLKLDGSPYLLFGASVLVANIAAALLAVPTEMRHAQLTRFLVGEWRRRNSGA